MTRNKHREIQGSRIEYPQTGDGPNLLLLRALLTELTVFDPTWPALAECLANSITDGRYQTIADRGHCPMVEPPAALTRYIEADWRSVN